MDEMMNKVVEPESPEAVEMRRQVEAAIERDKLDPRQQSYMFNKTTRKLIKTNEMYHRAVENRDHIEIITYSQAMALYKQEKAVKAQALANVTKRKRAKQARKKNR
jgi:hypothetical protein